MVIEPVQESNGDPGGGPVSHDNLSMESDSYGNKIRQLFQKLKALRPGLRSLHNSTFCYLTERVAKAKLDLQECQLQLQESPLDNLLLSQEKSLSLHYKWLKVVEQDYLRQRAKVHDLMLHDSNTRYFYAKIADRQTKKVVGSITDGNGTLCSGVKAITQGFLSYYKCFLGTTSAVKDLPTDLFYTQTVSPAVYPNLQGPITDLEILIALKSIDRNKSPGVDGYTSGFFQDAWSVVGKDFTAAVREFFSKGTMPKAANSTLLVLVPKKPIPASVTDFRPIACCTTFYKVVSKVLAKRIKTILPDIIGQEQAALTQDRDLFDNSMLALSSPSSILGLCLPLDMTFLFSLEEMFPPLLLLPTALKGLRTTLVLKQTLLSLVSILGGGVADDVKAQILSLTHFTEGEFPFRYLGLPLHTSRLTNEMYYPLLEKLRVKIGHWTNSHLSYAGKLQLINSVIFGMQNFWGASVILPKGIVKKINKIRKDILWGIEDGKRRHVFKSWQTLCLAKAEGGMDIKEVIAWNHALMIKWVWKFLHRPDVIWARWVHAYLLKGVDLWNIPHSVSQSWYWNNVLYSRDRLLQLAGTPSLAAKCVQDCIQQSQFLCSSMYELLRLRAPLLPWSTTIHSSISVPKHSFISLLATQNSLPAIDNLCARGLHLVNRCSLCENAAEQGSHLFFTCPYSTAVWRHVGAWLKVAISNDLPGIHLWFQTLNKGSKQAQ
ncbi:uncharacterized protein LOC141614064 [Silene latifolia]|uniref:uncharacterized protein LOC141614064 n=1 Tax=Silene latifolia TaxID=37657 RepID=UPI003D76E2AF